MDVLALEQIDVNIRDLVLAINEIPGVETVGSCGGHENPNGCQSPEGSFYVTFKTTWDEVGQTGLSMLLQAVSDGPPPPFEEIETIDVGVFDSGHGPTFGLNAWDGVSPDVVAAMIRATLAAWDEGW